MGGYRLYHTEIKQFLKQDSYSPFRNNQTTNSFNYAAGNPVFFIDRTGHMIRTSSMRRNPLRRTSITSTTDLSSESLTPSRDYIQGFAHGRHGKPNMALSPDYDEAYLEGKYAKNEESLSRHAAIKTSTTPQNILADHPLKSEKKQMETKTAIPEERRSDDPTIPESISTEIESIVYLAEL